MNRLTHFLRLGLLVLAIPVNATAQPSLVVAVDGVDREAKQPQVAIDAKGRIYVTFGVGNVIRCARSDDGGKTFEVSTVGSVNALSLGMRRGPRVAIAGGETVVVSAVGGREGKGRDGDLLAWRSTDGGKTWSGPTRVNTVEGSAREGLHAMAGGPDGSIYCSWLDLRTKKTEIYGSRSKDGGATWNPTGWSTGRPTAASASAAILPSRMARTAG